VFALVLAGYSIWRQLDEPVRAVRVQGALTEAERQAIQAVVMENLSGGVLSIDVDGLVRAIEALSWPRDVKVRRLWPDALTIEVERESVVAAWGDGGFLTSAGKVVQVADGPEDVPHLAAALSTPRQTMEFYQRLSLRLAPNGLNVIRLEENALGEWTLTLQSGMTVALGNEALGERVTRFLLAHQRLLSTRASAIAHVDTRYTNGVAVRWADNQLASAGSTR
jgi:cell division protein FtsQ